MKTNHQAQTVYRLRIGLALTGVLALAVVECHMVWRFGQDCGHGRAPAAIQAQTGPDQLIPPGQIQGWGDLLAAR